MDLKVLTPEGKLAETLAVSEQTFGREFNEALVHQVVTAYQAAGRQGTKAQKNRSDVSGGNSKPWAQKGTGRARAGTTRGPLWRTGGVTFAARPRDFSQKVNRKMYRCAMQSIFSELVRQNRLIAVNELKMEQPKTKELLKKLQQLDANHVLIITNEVDENLFLSARNLPNVAVIDVQAVDPTCLIAYKKVVITVPAVRQVEGMLA